jgi:tetratricopeptide (TPR) repeat protein
MTEPDGRTKRRWIDFGAYKLPLPPNAKAYERLRHSRAMLFRVLNMKNVVAVVGSGCSAAFGYPDWQRFALGLVQKVRMALKAVGEREAAKEFLRFEQNLKKKRRPSTETLMFYIAACQRWRKRLRDQHQDPYRDYFTTEFKPTREPVADPYQALLALPVYRFITTNYDRELENALERYRGVDRKLFEAVESPLSFTQKSNHIGQLIRFVLGRTLDNRNMVFHCHGRCDNPEDIIASEADYQEWYLTDRGGEALAFRQNIELLLESNPLLCIGYSMEDADLLQPLRYLGAIAPQRKQSRPIFALLEEGGEESIHKGELLFERYGIHVITYKRKAGEEREKALVRALRKLKAGFEKSHDEWFSKPKVRQPPEIGRKTKLCKIPDISPETMRLIQAFQDKDRVQEMADLISNGARVIGFIGPSGCGKTWNAVKLVEELSKRGKFAGCFYWNTHYSNESFTILEQLLRFIEGDAAVTDGTNRTDRLVKRLCARKPYLIVIDGCERLVRPLDRPGAGRSYGAGFAWLVRQVLLALAADHLQSVIVMVGRRWPLEMADAARADAAPAPAGRRPAKIVEIPARRAQLSLPPGRRKEFYTLASLLRGHRFGLLLADGLTGDDPEELEKLVCVLSDEPPKRRFGAMVTQVLKASTEAGRNLLERVAWFIEPIPWPTLKVCYESALGEDDADETKLKELVSQLVSRGLLWEVQDPEWESAYVVHASVRSYLARRDRVTYPVALPDFALLGYAGGTAGVDPGPKDRVENIEGLFRRLCGAARCSIDSSGDRRTALQLCRDAFGVLRSQMECSTAARSRDFDSYMRNGILLACLLKELAPGIWTFKDPALYREIEHAEGSLFIPELAWLYNDVGMALFCEGLLPDAFAVWEQAHEISRVLESFYPYGEYVLESLLNLTHTLIELGQVPDAMEYLEEASVLNGYLEDEQVKAKIACYQAYAELIRGNLRRADDLFRKNLRILRGCGNRHGTSFFLTLQAGLKIQLEQFEKARELARESRSLAEAGGYPDLAAYARIPEADALMRQGKAREARAIYGVILAEAQRMGARALEAFVRLQLADLSLDQGDAEGARRAAMQALKLANELGLELLTTRTLIVLARATYRSGQRDLGIGYLKIAEQRARRQDYGLRLREAERYLQDETLLGG